MLVTICAQLQLTESSFPYIPKSQKKKKKKKYHSIKIPLSFPFISYLGQNLCKISNGEKSYWLITSNISPIQIKRKQSNYPKKKKKKKKKKGGGPG